MFGWFAKLLHGTCSVPATEAPPPPPPPRLQQLPFDLLLEIVARVDDPATVVCCAATCKTLRRGVLDPSFRRRRLALLGGCRGPDGFDPTLLLGFSYRLKDVRSRIDDSAAHVVRTATTSSPRPRLRVRPRLLEAFEPVAWRDGLIVLRLGNANKSGGQQTPRRAAMKFHVWDALTAHATSLPSVETGERHYPLALLNVVAGGTGHRRRSFELLVADCSMRYKIFSSTKNGRWGAERAVPVPPPLCRCPDTQPAVIGRTVYWLCRGWSCRDQFNVDVHALDSEAGVATTVPLPPEFRSQISCYERDDTGILLASVGGRLSLLVADAETSDISMWTLLASAPPAPSWSWQVVLSAREVETRAGLRLDVNRRLAVPDRLEAYGERSGAVILQTYRGELVRLDLGTKEVTLLRKCGGQLETELVSRVCLYEIDLPALLRAMKSF